MVTVIAKVSWDFSALPIGPQVGHVGGTVVIKSLGKIECLNVREKERCRNRWLAVSNKDPQSAQIKSLANLRKVSPVKEVIGLGRMS